MKERVTMRKRIIVLLMALAIAFLAIVRFRLLIIDEIQTQISANLKDVANQNIITMENALNDKKDLLVDLANQIETKNLDMSSEEDIHEIIDFLKPFMEIYRFKRMGVITIDGAAHCTDGCVHELENNDAYLYGMQGMPNITSRIEDSIGEPGLMN